MEHRRAPQPPGRHRRRHGVRLLDAALAEKRRPADAHPYASHRRLDAPAEVDVEMAMTRGIASPRACGQAITSTVTVRTKASLRPPCAHQSAKVAAPDTVAT